MAIMTYTKFHSNRLMLTLIFGIWASDPPPQAWQSTENAGRDRVKQEPQFFTYDKLILFYVCICSMLQEQAMYI